MAYLVRHYIELPNRGWGHRHIVAERTDGASISISHASDDEDGNWECQRNRDHIPPSQVLGKKIARLAQFVREGAASTVDVQGRGRRLAFNDLDIGFSVRYHLDIEPVFVGLLEEVNRRLEICGVDERPLVVRQNENLVAQFFRRPGKKAEEEVEYAHKETPQGRNNSSDNS